MTNIFLTTAAADAAVTAGTGTKWKAGQLPGASTRLLNKNGVASSSQPLQMTDSATAGTDGTLVAWYTEPLKAVTIAGAITASVWTKESATTVNLAPSIQIERCSADGTPISTIVDRTTNNAPGEMGTTTGGSTDSIAVSAANVVDTTLADGDRLRITLYIDAAVRQGGSGAMAAGNGQFWVNGPNGASGQSQIAFTEVLSPVGALLAEYSFDEASGNVINLQGNSALDFAVPTGVARTTGHTNSGLAPTTTVSVVGPSTLVGQTPQRTLMMWVKTTADFTGWAWEHHDVPLDTGIWGLLCLSGNMGFRGRNAGGSTAHAAVARPTDNAWHHWAGTYDGVNVRTYLDGTLVATTALAGPIDTSIPDEQRLFTTVGAVITIDDLRVYDTTLTASEISTLMGTPAGPAGSTLTLNGSLASVTGTADVTASDDATLSGSLASVTGALAATAEAPATLAGSLAPATGGFAVDTYWAVTLDGSLTPVTGALAVDAASAATLAGTLTSITGSLAADAVATLAADGSLAPVTGSLAGDASATASLTASLASVTGAFTADVAGGGVSGAIDGSLQSVTASLAVTASDGATLAGNLAPVTAAVNVTAQLDATMAGTLSPATAQLVVDAAATGALAGALGSVSGAFAANTIEGAALNGVLTPVIGSLGADVGADATFSAQLSAAIGSAIVQASDDLQLAGQLSAIVLELTVQVTGVPRDIIAVVTANLETNTVIVQSAVELATVTPSTLERAVVIPSLLEWATVTEGGYDNYKITEGDMRPKWRVGTIEFVDFSVNVKDADGGGLTQADVEGYGWKIAIATGAATPALADFVVPSVTPVIEPDTEGGFDVAIKHLYEAAEKGLYNVYVHFGPTPESPILPAASFQVL